MAREELTHRSPSIGVEIDLEDYCEGQPHSASPRAIKAKSGRQGSVEVYFSTTKHTVAECDGLVEVSLGRCGDLSCELSVAVRLREGSAKAGEHYVDANANENSEGLWAFFPADSATTKIEVDLLDNDEISPNPDARHPDLNFFLDIIPTVSYRVDHAAATLEVVVQDTGGVRGTRVCFVKRHYSFLENVGIAVLEVQRQAEDLSVPMKVSVHTKSDTAVDGKHYLGGDCCATFAPDQKVVQVRNCFVARSAQGAVSGGNLIN